MADCSTARLCPRPAAVERSSSGVDSLANTGTSRAVCPVCCRSIPLTKAGLLRVHGPLSNQCEGSGMSPSSPPSSTSRSSLQPSSSSSSRRDSSTSIAVSGPAASAVGDGSRETSSSQSSLPLPSSFLLFSELRQSVRLLKRIPHASRHLAASKLASILDEVTMKNDFTSWSRLLQFSHRCFGIPTRGCRRRSLATLINRQLQEEAIPSISQCPKPGNRPSDPLRTLARRVSSKLEEGDYRGAVRTACSEDSVADITEEVISELKAKHPPAHQDSHIVQPSGESIL